MPERVIYYFVDGALVDRSEYMLALSRSTLGGWVSQIAEHPIGRPLHACETYTLFQLCRTMQECFGKIQQIQTFEAHKRVEVTDVKLEMNL